MKIGQLSSGELQRRLQNEGLWFRTGPFITHLRTSLSIIREGLSTLYPDFNVVDSADYADFHVEVNAPASLRRWFRPQVVFKFDGYSPFRPLPLSQALPVFEWGLNWCIGTSAHQYLISHAAVIERNGFAVIMPAPPGTGKSTLCAGLVNRGWRLLSDELALISRENGQVVSIPRPVSLKNESIDIIRQYARDKQVVIGPEAKDTLKGNVAHMRAPQESVERELESAIPAWIIFPEYVADAKAEIFSRSKPETFMMLAENTFNYNVLGQEGFELLGDIVDVCDCYGFRYSKLDDAVAIFDMLKPPQTN